MQKSSIISSLQSLGIIEQEAESCLCSYDAIIPLINKLWKKAAFTTDHFLREVEILRGENASVLDVLDLTPAELCEALLRANGLWKE